jgi:hypothetical protein
MNWTFKTKITAKAAILVKKPKPKLAGLRESPDAARAQHLANHAPVLEQRNFLQIGAESPLRGAQGEAAVMTKSRGFSTSIALCHC